jgi:phosphoketolase
LLRNKLTEHKQYIHERGVDLPKISDWTWPY